MRHPRSLVAGCCSLLTAFSFLHAQEAKERGQPLAAKAVAGLAAAYKGDAGLAENAEVIFAETFEGEGELGEGWDERRNDNNAVLSLADPAEPKLGRRCLRVESRLGVNTGGGLTKWFESSEKIFIRFYTKFDAQCDYVHHFVTLRANRGLHGRDRWSGFGGAGLKPGGADRFSTAIEPWGDWGKHPAPGAWNFYSYWHEMKASRDGKYWGNSFMPDPPPRITRGRWICVEFMLKHNTPGQPDGEQAFWIDGVEAGRWTGINWRTSPTLLANALTLETYVTDRWTKQETNVVFFDNVAIARAYIGPAGE